MSAETFLDRLPPWDPARFPPALDHSGARTLLGLSRDPINYLVRARKQLGPVFSLRLPPYGAMICAADAELNKIVLTDQERFVGGDAASILVPWIGPSSLIITPPPRHLPNRRLLLPPFHGEHVVRWGERMRELVAGELDRLPRGEPTAIRPMAQRLALDVILRLVFGIKDDARIREFRAALDAFLNPRLTVLLFLPPLQRDLGPLSPGGIMHRRRQRVIDLILAEVGERRRNLDSAADDVLSLILGAKREDGSPGFSDDELLDELRGLVIAGHETTATALAWTLHLLAFHPEEQEKLAESLAEGDDAYLKAVIRESMRLRPPVFDAVRTATGDTELGGRPVPKGGLVSAMFTVTHRDPSLWPEPERFRPERHLEDEVLPYALTPFGGGVRRCLGAALANLELEVAVREFLTRTRIKPAGAPEVPRLHGVTLIPARGGRVVLEPRPA